MSLTFGLKCARDLLSKLERDAQLLDQEVTSDRFFNFVVTGYSLIDWIKNDPSVPALAKVPPEIESLYKDRWLKICGDIATASKHLTLTRRTPVTTSASTAQGWSVGRFGKGAWGVGEESIQIVEADGTTSTTFDLVAGVLKTWREFFTRHGI